MKTTNSERIQAADKMFDVGTRSHTQYCKTCGTATRESKPFCSDHVESHAYVKGVLAVLQEMENEQEQIKTASRGAWKRVDIHGPKCDEIMLYLNQHGARTAKRVLRDVFSANSSVKTVEIYSEALQRAGLITMCHTSRGSLVLRSTQPIAVDSVTACA